MAEKQIPRTLWSGCSEREVLFGIYHEFARPILSIKGYSNLLLTADLSAGERLKAAQQIADSVESLERLKDSLNEYLQELRELT